MRDEVTERLEARRREVEAARGGRRRRGRQVRALQEAQERARAAIEQATAARGRAGAAGRGGGRERAGDAGAEGRAGPGRRLRGVRGCATATLDRPTLGAKFPLDPEAITLLVKAARELARIGMVDWRLAEMRALQRASL